MNSRNIWVPVAMLATLVLLGGSVVMLTSTEGNNGQDPRTEHFDAQIQRLRSQVDDLSQQMDRSKADNEARIAQLQKQLELAEAEAERMSEELAAEQEARLQALNLEVFKEATARAQAEQELAELDRRLRQAQDELENARARQEQLQARMEQADDTTPRMEAEVEEALVALQKREAEIERLRQQNQRLQTERERALQRQIELEQTIIEEGGMVTLVKPLVFSPNYKPGTR